MRFIAFAVLLITSLTPAYSQRHTLRINIKEDAPLAATIYLNQGSTLVPVDSVTLGRGEFVFNTSKYKPGVYSFVLSDEMYIRFIINNEDVVLSTSLENITDSLQVVSSEENKLYYRYLRLREAHTKKINAINTLLGFKEKSNKFTKTLAKEKRRLEAAYNDEIRALINAKGSLMVSQIVLSELPVIPPTGLSKEEKQQFLISNWWSSFPFEYPYIMNSPDVSEKLWDYFDLFYDDDASRTEQIEYFKRVIDEVLNRDGIAPEVYDFFRKEMLKTFTQSSYDELISYIKNTYPTDIPDMDLEHDLDHLALSAIGQKAVDFEMDLDSTKTTLYKLQNNGTVVVFWSMNCSHCRQMLPTLQKNYRNMKERGIDLVLVNLDGYRPAWKLFVKENNLPGYNINIQNPFNSPVIDAYNVVGTPAIYVLDGNKVITAKPATEKEMYKAMELLVREKK